MRSPDTSEISSSTKFKYLGNTQDNVVDDFSSIYGQEIEQ